MFCTSAQFKEYLERAEYIKSVIDGQVTVPQASGTGQKARPNGAGGGGGGDKDGVRAWRIGDKLTSPTILGTTGVKDLLWCF